MFGCLASLKNNKFSWVKLQAVVGMLCFLASSLSRRAHAFGVVARPRMHLAASSMTSQSCQWQSVSTRSCGLLSTQNLIPSATNPPRLLTTRLFASSSPHGRRNDDNDNWKVPDTIHIPEETLDMSFIRSSGSGGQNVNKVNTQVQIKVMIDAMGFVPYEVRERIKQQQANRINKEGFLVLQVQEYRTQTQNRKAALQKLREMILQAWPRPKKRIMRTGISEKTKKQRKEFKQKRKLVKESRRRVDF